MSQVFLVSFRNVIYREWCNNSGLCDILTDDSSDQNKEIWNVFKTLRGHLDDVLDLSWSLDSAFLVSGEIGCTAIIWDVMKGKSKYHLNEHKNFVHGVAWDPKDKFVATISSDRYVHFSSFLSAICKRKTDLLLLFAVECYAHSM